MWEKNFDAIETKHQNRHFWNFDLDQIYFEDTHQIISGSLFLSKNIYYEFDIMAVHVNSRKRYSLAVSNSILGF